MQACEQHIELSLGETHLPLTHMILRRATMEKSQSCSACILSIMRVEDSVSVRNCAKCVDDA